MAKKVPVTIFVDPDVESTFTIKPFAGSMATKLQPSVQGAQPDGWTGTASGTGIGQPNPDVDADVDYSG